MLEFGLASIFGLIDDGTNFFLHITIRPDQPQQTSYDIYHVTTSFLSGNLNKAIRNFPTVTYGIQGSTSAIAQ